MAERILVVDDDEDIRRILAVLLARGGFEVIEAANGAAAIEIAESPNKLDLVLLDLHMPGISGFDVCQRIKGNPNNINLPIIFLTASGDNADKISAFDSGAADYITKSFNKSELIARVKTQLKLSSVLKDLERANFKLAHKQQEFQDDLFAAAKIQETLLPRALTHIPYINTCWRFLPSEIVAGDLFNVVPLGGNYVGIYILDVSGHGVSSAMVTVSLSQTLHGSKNSILLDGSRPKSPSKLISELNQLYPIERFGKYFTMVYMLLNLKTGELCYSAAGHPAPLLIRDNSDIITLSKGGTITGFEETVPFEEGALILNSNDRLILYTDGLTDHVKEDTPAENLLQSALKEYRHETLDILLDGTVEQMLIGTPHDELKDDVSLFALDYKPENNGR